MYKRLHWYNELLPIEELAVLISYFHSMHIFPLLWAGDSEIFHVACVRSRSNLLIFICYQCSVVLFLNNVRKIVLKTFLYIYCDWMQPCGRWRRQSARIARSLQGVIDSTPLDTTLRDAGRADPRRVLLADQPWPSPSVSLECRLHGATTTPPPPARMQSEFAAWYLVVRCRPPSDPAFSGHDILSSLLGVPESLGFAGPAAVAATPAINSPSTHFVRCWQP